MYLNPFCDAVGLPRAKNHIFYLRALQHFFLYLIDKLCVILKPNLPYVHTSLVHTYIKKVVRLRSELPNYELMFLEAFHRMLVTLKLGKLAYSVVNQNKLGWKWKSENQFNL